ncbi:MAG: hypothetical protein J6Z46_07875 [Lachnospiraceae bacterium]|nr:hypothetical protein [Lachnospiraceae bacterium]
MKLRAAASFTVEAVFVVSTVCIVLLVMISYTLELYQKASDLADTCKEGAKEITGVLKVMRLERLVGKVFGD